MKTIEIEVAATGEIKIEAMGFKGNACEKATAAIEAALGVKKSSKKKPEFYQREDKRTQIKQ